MNKSFEFQINNLKAVIRYAGLTLKHLKDSLTAIKRGQVNG